jgi:hypothetical protein
MSKHANTPKRVTARIKFWLETRPSSTQGQFIASLVVGRNEICSNYGGTPWIALCNLSSMLPAQLFLNNHGKEKS